MNTAHGSAISGGTSGLESAVRRYLGHLSADRGLAVNTLNSYRRDLLRYVGALACRGRSTLDQVGEDDIVAFLAGLREGDHEHPPLSAGSAARAAAAVRGLHRFALREGIAADDPARAVRSPAPPRRPPKAISVAEVERLIAAVGAAGPGGGAGGTDTALRVRDRALLEVLYGSGVRISEAVGLDVDDLDLAEGLVHVSGKAGRRRLVPVGAPARSALEEYLAQGRPSLTAAGHDDRYDDRPGDRPGGTGSAGAGDGAAGGRAPGDGGGALFLNARGGRLSRQGGWMVLRAAAGRAGLREVSPHTLRHSFATHLLEGGAEARVVQELLGHAAVTTAHGHIGNGARRLREAHTRSHPRARG